MVLSELQSELEILEQDKALLSEDAFPRRIEVLDALDLDILAIDELGSAGGATDEWQAVRRQAIALRDSLEATNERLFESLRGLIKSGQCTGEELRRRLQACAGSGPSGDRRGEVGYDSLDALIGGLLLTWPAPEETRPVAPEMVRYQPTPARIILDLVDQARFAPGDVFYDLGSGLGHVVILVHLLSGVKARGIEVEPAYCAYARQSAGELGLSQVEFVNADARQANLSEGTVFFLYTPFTGKLLKAVLRRLETVSHLREIRVCTYGPCTAEVLGEQWLACETPGRMDTESLAVFRSQGVRDELAG